MPIGPQLQALWRSLQSTKSMTYRAETTKRVMQQFSEITQGRQSESDFVYENIFQGTAYIEAVNDGKKAGRI